MSHQILLFLHIPGACVLIGTGGGMASFMAVSNRSDDPQLLAHTAILAETASPRPSRWCSRSRDCY